MFKPQGKVDMKTDKRALSELQGSLILLAAIIIAALVIKSTIGDSVVSASLDFGRFKVWGAHNNVSYSKDAPNITIANPPDESRFYSDRYTSISGNVLPSPGRRISRVYYRLNGGQWAGATLNNDTWTGADRRYPAGSYHVEAQAYDNAGERSPIASSTFETIFRPYPDSAYVEDDVPGIMTAGDLYNIHIKFLNTGYLPWNDSSGYRLAPDGSTMTLPSIGFNGDQIAPERSRIFNVSLTAPSPGTYTIGYRMWCSDFDWFGDLFTKKVRIVESNHDAKVVSVNMPSEMTPGDAVNVSITMQNTGTAAWFTEGDGMAYLGMVDGKSGDAYMFNGSSDRILISPGIIVRNGESYTFRFMIKAPALGSYYTQYRMMWDEHYAFGQIAGANIDVKDKIKITTTPTSLLQYNAHGKMILRHKNGFEYKGSIRYFYDGPLGKHFERSSRGASSIKDPRWDWDIGGPNGHYRIYNDVDGYAGGLEFDMNYGGSKGIIIFIK
jgi:hypothetical protein